MYLLAFPPSLFNMVTTPGALSTWTDVFYMGLHYVLVFWLLAKISSRKLPWGYYLLAFFLGQCTVAFLNNIAVILVIAAVFYFWIFHRTSSFNQVIAQLTGITFFCGTVETILKQIYRYLLFIPFHFGNVFDDNVNMILLDTFLSIFEIIIVVLSAKFLRRLLTPYAEVVVPKWPIVAWLMIAYYFAYSYLHSLAVYNIISTPRPVILAITVCGCLLFFAVMYWLTDYARAKNLTASQAVELDNIKVYTSHIESLYDTTRRFKHDYQNVLYSLDGALEGDDPQQARQILQRVIQPTSKEVNVRTSVLGRLENLKDFETKSLVYSKIMQGLNQKLDMQVEIERPVSLENKVAPLDMIRLLSILLDNAINSAKQTKDGVVRLSIFEKDGKQHIIVGNSIKEEQVNIQQLIRNTRRTDLGASHGIGLKNLRAILAKYPAIQHNIQSQDHWFEQEIVIPQG